MKYAPLQHAALNNAVFGLYEMRRAILIGRLPADTPQMIRLPQGF